MAAFANFPYEVVETGGESALAVWEAANESAVNRKALAVARRYVS